MTDEPLLTPRQVDALLLLAEHGPASRANRTAATLETEGGPALEVLIHGQLADNLSRSGHLMLFGIDGDGRQRYALTPLGWHVAEVARPGVEARRRVAIDRAAAERPAPCCPSHRAEGCCDVDDCGPCCPACPTCPTLEAQRQLESPS